MTSAEHPPSPRGPPPAPEQLLQRGKTLLAEGRAEESEAVFRQLAASSAHAAAALYGIGVARLAAGDIETAQGFLTRALARDPSNANALFYLGDIAQRRGATADARSCFERALAVEPGHAGAQRRLSALTPPASARALPVAPTAPTHGGAVVEYLRQDPTPLSQQTVAAIDALDISVHPKFSAYVGRGLTRFVLLGVLSLGIIPTIVFLRARSTTITLAQGRLQIRRGIFSRRLTNIDLWRVRDVTLERTFVNRLTGDGTIVLRFDYRPDTDATEPLELVGLARRDRLEQIYQQLLNVIFLLRSSPAVKGFIQ